MEKYKRLMVTTLVLLTTYCCVTAQGWCQDRVGVYSVGIGGADGIAVGRNYAGLTGPGFALNISGEYRVQRFIGVGFEAGMDLFAGPYYGYENVNNRNISLGIPVSVKANVHILEAANLPIADRLDVYAGLNLGAGPGFYLQPAGNIFAFIHTGPQVGIRYWPAHNIGVFAEFGWGATFANAGFCF